MKKIIKKILYCFMLVAIIINCYGGVICSAMEINSADIVSIGTADYHLKYFREDSDSYRYVLCTIVGHYNNDIFYPAYCMNKDLQGVDSEFSYSVNIKELINRNDIWRVVKNGYPYKTYQEMGLNNEFDAFAVTKFAVYCIIGQSDLEKFYAEPDDDEAIAMLNCLKNLVEIGRNGNETRTDGNFSISKIDEFIEEGEYYYQKYKVNSNLDMREINFSIVNLPDGCYISKIDDNYFKLYIPKDKLSEDINGEIKIDGKCKSYPIFYGESGNSETQDYLLTYDSFGEISSNCKINFVTNTGKIKVKKTDLETNNTIEGVQFKLYNSNGVEVGTKTTDSNGEVVFDNLFQGNYKIKEVKAHENYILDESEKDVKVVYNKTTNKDITNVHKKGNLKIYKVDKDNNKITLGNVKFDLYSEEFQKVIGTYSTNTNGEIYIKDLRIGDYKLIEKETGKWYNLTDDREIKIKWEEENENIIENELKKGQVKIIKVDKDNNEVKLEGVKFDILDEKGNKLETLETDKNGEAFSSKYPIRDYERLVIKEIETKKGYKLTEESQVIELKENEITTIEFENELKRGNVELIKLDKDDETPIKDVEFQLYNSNDELLGEFVTDEYGKIKVENLLADDGYYFKEIKSDERYEIINQKIIFNILEDETTEEIVYNEKIKSNFKIIKVDKENNEIKLEGVEFELLDDKSNLLEILVTDKDGCAYSRLYPTINKTYVLHEIKGLNGYKKLDEYTVFKLDKNKMIELIIENEKIKEEEKKEEPKEEKNTDEDIPKENREESKKYDEIDISKEEKVEISDVKILPRTGY